MDIALLESTMSDRGEPAYRTRQVWEWAARGAEGYDAMTNVPAVLREALTDSVPFSTLTVTGEQQARDGTLKTLFRTHDGHPVEAVLMRYRDGRRSICVSSQSGCPLTCTFCATGAMQFGRNLTPSEILDQALHFRAGSKGEVDYRTLRLHGHGRAVHQLRQRIAAARRLPDLGVTPRRTTISTVGWMPGLTRFIDEVDEPIRLALSLHAASPGLRSQLMPVNDRYPLPDVLAECRRYVELRGRKVYIEYVMLEGVNDTPRHAAELAAILDPKSFKVNLIPYNPTGMYGGSSRDAIAAFKHVLDRAGSPRRYASPVAATSLRRAASSRRHAEPEPDPLLRQLRASRVLPERLSIDSADALSVVRQREPGRCPFLRLVCCRADDTDAPS